MSAKNARNVRSYKVSDKHYTKARRILRKEGKELAPIIEKFVEDIAMGEILFTNEKISFNYKN